MSACVKKTGIPKIGIYPKWSHTNEGLGRGNKNLPRSCFYREHRREKPVHSSDMYPRILFPWKGEEAYRYADPVFLLHDVHQIVLYLVDGVVPGGVFLCVWKEEGENYLDNGEALKHSA